MVKLNTKNLDEVGESVVQSSNQGHTETFPAQRLPQWVIDRLNALWHDESPKDFPPFPCNDNVWEI